MIKVSSRPELSQYQCAKCKGWFCFRQIVRLAIKPLENCVLFKCLKCHRN